MACVIDYLKWFNRKERFILLDHVLGQRCEEVFRLNNDFRKELADKLRLEGIPCNAYVAMDYHLDWLQMALYLADKDGRSDAESGESIPNPESDSSSEGKVFRRLFQGNQEDIDLLVAFEERSQKTVHVVLIEAKGVTNWDPRQLKSKTARLNLIFKENSYGSEEVKPHFILMSPCRPKDGTVAREWPSIEGNERPAEWLRLPLPDKLLKATRGNQNSDCLDVYTYRKECPKWRRGLHV